MCCSLDIDCGSGSDNEGILMEVVMAELVVAEIVMAMEARGQPSQWQIVETVQIKVIKELI